MTCAEQKRIIRRTAVAVLLLLWSTGMFFVGRLSVTGANTPSRPQRSSPAESRSFTSAPARAEELSAEELKRLARAALRRAGIRQHPGGVTVEETLADGSCKVQVMLESGRSVSGRLFKDRARWRITLDHQDLYADKTIISIQ